MTTHDWPAGNADSNTHFSKYSDRFDPDFKTGFVGAQDSFSAKGPNSYKLPKTNRNGIPILSTRTHQ